MRTLQWLFGGVAAVSAVLLLARGFAGPFWIIHNPLTAEIALALSIICCLLTRASGHDPAALTPSGARWGATIVVALGSLAAFLPILSMPLISDDYIHVRQISTGEAPTPIGCLTQSCGGPRFFRPLPFATYWAEWELWGAKALPRHIFDLVLNTLSSVLFLLLVQRLGIAPPFDWLAGLLFAFNGIRAEAVAWPAARFDASVLLFSLVAAVMVLRGGRFGLICSVLATAAACLSKECAYVLPVLLGLLLGRGALTRAGKIVIASNTAVAAAIFVWRLAVLRGMGGYVQQDGTTPALLQFNLLVVVKTFLSRIWAVLWFPVNWARPLEWWMVLGLGAGVIGSCLLLGSRAGRGRMLLCMAGVVVACLPTYNMLLIAPSLERSRYLDLASPAFALLLVFACIGLPRRVGMAALAALVVFQLTALEHNLQIWSDVSKARYQLCRGLAERARTTEGRIRISGVPVTVDGVYWRNGIEDCLWLEFGVPMGTILVNEP